MEDSTEQAVRRAIATMRENMGEQLTVDDIARAALFSKFHFTRIFQRRTGLSPGRFLSALRLQKAKELLLSTSLNVADISLMVGYNSVGTFSYRFSRSVGMPPTVYRQSAGFATDIHTAPTRAGTVSTARVSGRIHSAGESTRLVFLGLFPDRLPEGKPVRCTVLQGEQRFRFDAVQPGRWFLLAHSVPVDEVHETGTELRVASVGPLDMRHDTTLDIDVRLEPAQVLDPPVLLALLDARALALASAPANGPTTRPNELPIADPGGYPSDEVKGREAA